MYYLRMKYLNEYFQSLLGRGVSKCVKVNKPMFTNRQKVLHAIIRSPGMVVNMRNMVKISEKSWHNQPKVCFVSICGQGVFLLNYENNNTTSCIFNKCRWVEQTDRWRFWYVCWQKLNGEG